MAKRYHPYRKVMEQIALYGSSDRYNLTVRRNDWVRVVLSQDDLLKRPNITLITDPYGQRSNARAIFQGWLREAVTYITLLEMGVFSMCDIPKFRVDGWNSEHISWHSYDVRADDTYFEVKPRCKLGKDYRLVKADKLKLQHNYLALVREDGVMRFIKWADVARGHRTRFYETDWVLFTPEQMKLYGMTADQFREHMLG